MKSLAKLSPFLISFLIISACSSGYKKGDDKYFDRLNEMTSKLIVEGKISTDSSIKIINQYINLKTDSAKALFVDEFEKKVKAPPIPKMSNSEYFQYFSKKYNKIKLEKLFEQAPLYGKYADDLAGLIAEMDETNTMYNILIDSKIKQLYDKIENKNKIALDNYLKYGEPDEDFIYINAACETALKQVLKDPDYEILKDKYYLKQTNTGYNYKLLIRAKNSFGASVQQEMTFSLKYNSFDKMYKVIDVN